MNKVEIGDTIGLDKLDHIITQKRLQNELKIIEAQQ